MSRLIVGVTCFIALAVFLSGCIDGKQILFKEIPGAIVPSPCESFAREHICALFKCMVDSCWCDEGSIPSPILEEPSAVGSFIGAGTAAIKSDQDAIAAVQRYVQRTGSEYSDVRRAVKLNNVFWNVFAFNSENDETVFTVAADGTILKTVCGV